MPFPLERTVSDYVVRPATAADLHGARAVMLDTFYREFGHGFIPRWHSDVIDMHETYLAHEHNALFVAVTGDTVVGTTAVRAEGPRCPPHPQWLAERYPSGTTAQLFRVYIDPAHRRHGLARALVDAACEHVARTPIYTAIYLHTNPAVPGAEPFWRSIAHELYDARGTDYSPSVHFEIPVPALV